MKQSILFLALVLSTTLTFAQESRVLEVEPGDQEVVATELEIEAEKPEHDKKTKKFLRKVAKFFKETPKKIGVEIKKLDDCVNCENKTKSEIVVTNIGRALGKGSAWVSTKTSKPFANAAGFLTGAFEKKDKNQDIVALYKFFLNHSDEFDKLYLEAGTPEDMIELMLGAIQEIVEKKTHLILADALKSLGVDKEIPADLSDFELTPEEIAKIDLTKVSPDLINNHPEYAELRPILGYVKSEELMEIITLGYFDRDISFENYKAALPKIHEGVITIAGQVLAPKIALGVISKSLGGLYALPVIAADIGTGVSTAICLSAETKEKIKSDKDLKAFCSYVVNHSGMELMKSRARGYVAGKSFRQKLEEKLAKGKAKREKRRAERKLRREQNA